MFRLSRCAVLTSAVTLAETVEERRRDTQALTGGKTLVIWFASYTPSRNQMQVTTFPDQRCGAGCKYQVRDNRDLMSGIERVRGASREGG
eukprot:1404660-Rhodomonas_salina.1